MIKLIISENKRVDVGNHDRIETDRAFSQETFGNGGIDQSPIRNTLSSGVSMNGPQTFQKVEEHIFVFRYDEIFTDQELKMNGESINELKTLKRMVGQAIAKRLKVREVPNILNMNNLNQVPNNVGDSLKKPKSVSPYRYIAFFLDDRTA